MSYMEVMKRCICLQGLLGGGRMSLLTGDRSSLVVSIIRKSEVLRFENKQ